MDIQTTALQQGMLAAAQTAASQTAASQAAAQQARERAAMQPKKVTKERLGKFTATLQKYKAGKKNLEQRVVEAEQWWKLRNWEQMRKQESGFSATSGWLHNVIVNKHADMMEAYPEPDILPREEGDRAEAKMLSSIVPVILEQNDFEDTFDKNATRKCVSGTGVYKIAWDAAKLNGLGDVSVKKCSLLNLFWEPGIEDIQESRYFFHTELHDKELLIQQYPQLEGKLTDTTFTATKFLYDDAVDTTDKVTVVDVYYHEWVDGKKILHYCKYVGDQVLYATEDDHEIPTRTETDPATGAAVELPAGEPRSRTGWYDHGLYPYVFDPLFEVEGSPCGYGYVDLCKSAQERIDLVNRAITENAAWGARPRYFRRTNGGINDKQFLDTNNPLVDVTGNVDETSIRQIVTTPFSGVYIQALEEMIGELRETSGNTETSAGTTSGGVTAASAIAALQEASGKGSRAANRATYAAYRQIVMMVIELIRQFYDLPRKFRILGDRGGEEYITYSNQNLKPQDQGTDFGLDMGARLPVFDVKVSAEKQNTYTKVSQNELALQFFQLGFFNEQFADQALMCLDVMDFEGKEDIIQKVSQYKTTRELLAMYQQLALTLAAKYEPQLAEGLAQQVLGGAGQGQMLPTGGAEAAQLSQPGQESSITANARARSAAASQPDGGQPIAGERA